MPKVRSRGPYGADHMGLIYVNPEGPNGNPDPALAARYIRQTFKRMAMNDEETVALIAGGHTFGKAHGAAAESHVGPDPEGADIEEQGLGWTSDYASGKANDTITSGLEGAWTDNPVKWDNNFLENLYEHEWELTKSPAGKSQYQPENAAAAATVIDAHDPSKKHAPMMLTTDLSLRMDPAYAEISTRFLNDPAELEDAFARAWFKLLHRDLGPRSRYRGSLVPDEALLWQDPRTGRRPRVDRPGRDRRPEGANPRLWPVLFPVGLDRLGLRRLVPRHRQARRRQRGARPPGAAEGLGSQRPGSAHRRAGDPGGHPGRLQRLAVQRHAGFARRPDRPGRLRRRRAGRQRRPATTCRCRLPRGRTDATEDWTDAESFAVLEPAADGFRNYLQADQEGNPEELLVERAYMLTLTAPEMTALVGGLRALNANTGQSQHGVLTDRPGALSNDFFVNLLDPNTVWQASGDVFEGRDQASGDVKWTGTRVDLVFGSNSELRALAEVYGSDDGQEAFVGDFVAAWDKVMSLDRFDLE